MAETIATKLQAKDIQFIKDSLNEIKSTVADIKSEQKNFVTTNTHNSLVQELKAVENKSELGIATLNASIDVVKNTMSNNRLVDLLETQKINAKIAKFVGVSLGGLGVLQVIALVEKFLNK